MPEAGRWETFGSGSEVLKAFGPDCPGSCTPCVFPLPLEGQQCKVGNKPSQNPAKSLETTQKNEVKWTLFIWLSLSGFWRWNVTICEIYETFLGITCVLPRSTVANYKQCTSSNSVSNNWRHAASNPQGCVLVVIPVKSDGKASLKRIHMMWVSFIDFTCKMFLYRNIYCNRMETVGWLQCGVLITILKGI